MPASTSAHEAKAVVPSMMTGIAHRALWFGIQPSSTPTIAMTVNWTAWTPRTARALAASRPVRDRGVVPRNLMASLRRSNPVEIARAVKELDMTARAMMLGTSRSRRAERPETPSDTKSVMVSPTSRTSGMMSVSRICSPLLISRRHSRPAWERMTVAVACGAADGRGHRGGAHEAVSSAREVTSRNTCSRLRCWTLSSEAMTPCSAHQAVTAAMVPGSMRSPVSRYEPAGRSVRLKPWGSARSRADLSRCGAGAEPQGLPVGVGGQVGGGAAGDALALVDDHQVVGQLLGFFH